MTSGSTRPAGARHRSADNRVARSEPSETWWTIGLLLGVAVSANGSRGRGAGVRMRSNAELAGCASRYPRVGEIARTQPKGGASCDRTVSLLTIGVPQRKDLQFRVVSL